MSVLKFVTACALSSAALTASVVGAPTSTAQSTDPVVQWNRTLLAIVRTPGAQPATIHPTRSFAMLHAAIYDAVNQRQASAVLDHPTDGDTAWRRCRHH